ncbi:MAG: calcium/sodium antiporter [Candidatus Aenigmarchaeota archaeon]|nr:calcium/sodium antiporter [Candidatus Aenigmarchaeota archaeon]
MLTLLFWVLVFVVSLGVLLKSADFFTDSAEEIGLALGIPAFIVGVTIVSIGTSLPELASSIVAVLEGSSEIVSGNVVGSNITNILLVLGVSTIIAKKLTTSWELVRVDLPVLIGSALLLVATCLDGVFTFWDAVLFIIGYIIYISYTISMQKRNKREMIRSHKVIKKLRLKPILILIMSSIFIYISAKYMVESIIQVSQILKIGTEVLAATVVALGTSFPELIVSATAARKGKGAMAIGNILGSNIFNTFVVMGVPGLIGTILVPNDMIYIGLPVMLGATILYFFETQDREVTGWEGGILLLLYAFFIMKLFGVV